MLSNGLKGRFLLVSWFLLSGLPLLASAGEVELTRSQRNAVYKVMVCARDLAQSGKAAGPEHASYALENARRSPTDLAKLEQLEADCQETLRSLAEGVPVDPVSTPVSPAVDRLVSDFKSALSPGAKLECLAVGPEVMVALGIAVEADVEAGTCTASDSRRWLMIGAGLGLGFGVGVETSFHISAPVVPADEAVSFSTVDYFGAYLGVGVSANSQSDGEDFFTEGAIGVGLGRFVVKRAGVQVHLIPVGTDKKRLVKQLFREL